MTYRLSGRARRDLLQIWNYIAEDNEPAADRFIDLLINHFEMLGRNPYAGRRRDELRAGYRSFPVGHYVILYRAINPSIQIMHVIHGKRDIQTLFNI